MFSQQPRSTFNAKLNTILQSNPSHIQSIKNPGNAWVKPHPYELRQPKYLST